MELTTDKIKTMLKISIWNMRNMNRKKEEIEKAILNILGITETKKTS